MWGHGYARCFLHTLVFSLNLEILTLRSSQWHNNTSPDKTYMHNWVSQPVICIIIRWVCLMGWGADSVYTHAQNYLTAAVHPQEWHAHQTMWCFFLPPAKPDGVRLWRPSRHMDVRRASWSAAQLHPHPSGQQDSLCWRVCADVWNQPAECQTRVRYFRQRFNSIHLARFTYLSASYLHSATNVSSNQKINRQIRISVHILYCPIKRACLFFNLVFWF